MRFRVLFVCTGNTCRSPLAEVLARHLLAGEEAGADAAAGNPIEWEVSSAGVFAADGNPASDGSLQAARERSLDLESFRSRQLTEEIAAAADLVLVMEASHRATVLGVSPEADTKTRLLGELGGLVGPAAEVPDPFGGTIQEYRRTLELIEKHLRAGLGRLRELAAGRANAS